MNKSIINIDDENAEIHNIKSISRMNSFLKRLVHSFFSIYNDTMCFCEYCGNNELGYKAKNYIDFFKTPKELFIK